MKQYFEYVVHSLNGNDLQVLGYLYDNEIDAKYKSIRNTTLFEKLKLTEAKYRKIIQRLLASKMIEADTTQKNQTIYINEFGVKAVEELLKGVEQ